MLRPASYPCICIRVRDWLSVSTCLPACLTVSVSICLPVFCGVPFPSPSAGKTDASLSLKSYPGFNSALFQGAIDYNDGNPLSKGGFASFRTKPDEKSKDLSSYDALEMRVKTDGRP